MQRRGGARVATTAPARRHRRPFPPHLRSLDAPAVSRFRYLNYEILRFKRASRRNFPTKVCPVNFRTSARGRCPSRCAARARPSFSLERVAHPLSHPRANEEIFKSPYAQHARVNFAPARALARKVQSRGGLLIGGNGVSAFEDKRRGNAGWSLTHTHAHARIRRGIGRTPVAGKTARSKRVELCRWPGGGGKVEIPAA